MSTLAQKHIAEHGTPTETIVFEDGSAAFACFGWRFGDYLWISDGHFIGCVPKDHEPPEWPTIECPPHFVAALSRCPKRAYIPVEDGDVVRVGPISISKLYFDTMIDWYGTLVRWYPADDPKDGVFVVRFGKIVGIVETLAKSA
jgi:hypothetical protein